MNEFDERQGRLRQSAESTNQGSADRYFAKWPCGCQAQFFVARRSSVSLGGPWLLAPACAYRGLSGFSRFHPMAPSQYEKAARALAEIRGSYVRETSPGDYVLVA